MNIFQIKNKPHGKERLNEFLNFKFICIGWPEIGNLEGVTKEEIRKRLEKRYYKNNESDTRRIGVDLGNIWSFVDTMQDGDIVLFNGHLDQVHVVKVGSYKYVKEFDNDTDGMCHQREFKLLATLPNGKLSNKLQELMRHRGTVTKFKYPLKEAKLDLLINESEEKIINESIVNQIDKNIKVPEEIIDKALKILFDELESNDSGKRVESAIEILRLLK